MFTRCTMKLYLLTLLLLSFGAQAQSIDAGRIKKEILKRASELRAACDEGIEFFKNRQVQEGCEKVSFIFQEMPNHLSSVMSRMNIFDRKIEKIKTESLEMLKESHRLEMICKQDEAGVNLDSEKARKFLRSFSKAMKRHEKVILKSSTDFNNTYYYQYDF